VKGEMVYSPGTDYLKPLYGYTIIDSLKAILRLSHNEFQKLYGWSSDRAMIFTRVSTGRSPMVALRVTNLKPALMVIHGRSAKEIDPIAIKIAEIEHVPLVATVTPMNELIRSLQTVDIKR
jgi:putative transcriptional regulator